MWEKMSEMEQMMRKLRIQLEMEEKALDNAIAEAKEEDIPISKEDDRKYAKKERVVK
jgi:hypothetical protein